MAFWQKTAFEENHGFCDFRVTVIFSPFFIYQI